MHLEHQLRFRNTMSIAENRGHALSFLAQQFQAGATSHIAMEAGRYVKPVAGTTAIKALLTMDTCHSDIN